MTVIRPETAYHEAAHAVATVLLGGRLVGPVSVREALRWRGVAFVRPPAASAAEVARTDVSAPLPLWPARVRRQHETGIMISMAGPVGARYAPPVGDRAEAGYFADPVAAAEAALERVVRVSDRDARMLATGDDPDADIRSDFESAHEAAAILTGPAGIEPLLRFLHAETEAFVASYGFLRRLRPLAEALLEREVISAAETRRILRAASPTTTTTGAR